MNLQPYVRFAAMTASLWATTTLATETGLPTEPESRPVQTIDVYSATDKVAIEPVFSSFERQHPDLRINYHEYDSNDLFEALTQNRLPDADVVISSAMDLQVKLVNDGFTQPLAIPPAESLPAWSRWRNEAFGFTFEPVVIAYNRAAFEGTSPPRSHEALVNALRTDPQRYANQVGSYDIRLSGAGYFFATQDDVVSSITGRMRESLARANTRIYCCTSEMLDDLASGELVLAYNMLGSYALARAREDARIGVILPEDYTLVMSRVAIVPKQSDAAEAAGTLVRYLLSREGQQVMAAQSDLVALHPGVVGPSSISAISDDNQLRFHPIKVGQPLLTYQDPMKRERFIREWMQLFVAP